MLLNHPDAKESGEPKFGEATVPRRLSEDIELLLAEFAERPVRLGEVMDLMRHRSYSFLLILLCLPFCTPIPLPGLSTPFGLVVALIGLRLALGQAPWVPQRMLQIQLPAKLLPRVLMAAEKLIARLEYFLKPRCAVVFKLPFLENVMGLMILIVGALLLLPLPIPFTNFAPALTVILLASAMIEKDGYFVIAGTVAFVVTILFFTALFFGGISAGVFVGHFYGD